MIVRRLAQPLVLVALATLGVHLTTFLARPVASYRVLALGGDARAVGLVAAAGAFLPIFLALPMGRSADRGRLPWLLLGGALLLAAGTFLLANAGSLGAMAGGNVVLGTGQLALMLAFQSLVAALSAPEHQDRNFGWFTAAASAGQLAGPLVGGWVVGGGSGDLLAETRVAFLIGTAASAAILLLCVPLAASARRGAPTGRTPVRRGSATVLLRNRRLLVAIFTSFAVMSSVDVLTAYLPVLGHERGLAPSVVGALLAVRAGFSFVSRLLIPLLLARAGRLTVLMVSGALSAASLVALVFATQAWHVAVLMAVLGTVLGLGQPLTMTWTVREAPENLRSTALGLRLTGNRVAQAVAPAAAGAVSALVGVAGPFLFIAALLAASTVTVLPGWRAERGAAGWRWRRRPGRTTRSTTRPGSRRAACRRWPPC
ncbi:putative MFS family arabinose efflux permease [Prauserella shujinwangii]|uniref:Putative MFS family arabinose efflux permease n=1 Tax=Prauserella shujinwangii TaxID=1453103 RepID=A0A2T0LPK9_9PSEU|nr:putative MFS family arabinose efflux permease [Prauserella shujinwangii]